MFRLMSAPKDAPLFRIDRFAVPTNSLRPFLEQLHRVDDALGVMPGCKQNLVLTQENDNAECSVITLVEWKSREALTAARVAMQRAYAEQQFDPQAFMRRLGVRADLGIYHPA